ncbi:uncharacterized protein Z519_04310 [Cladophialophora bantiana CBS 173.52]|uniref:Zn(2)-C6 fungal-type domain-containing protein n=1 Tax=Cladophialophora bantiana (strain ATCC 10958 / CBS 173.52 / CDC B-1940 / NIH 8579) TaxID=1442370 RepID=A0A0D2HXQ7_CLAB1|nr:uncharacterized protein Z519_04310 [Cladophialophora bantiana CBS 173.52]KIW95725.1 hypothetical protein Z519_04310 [Cladophialophora bantiana CBS 173.52]
MLSARTDPGTAEIAIVRRADGRTLRKSCDRCHQQKLRCVGDKASLTRCKRCQRAGLECVYGARSSKKATQCSIDNFATWDGWPGNSATPTLNDPVAELDTIFGLELAHFDDIFAISPSSRPTTSGSTSLAAPNLPTFEHDAGTPVQSAVGMPLLSSSGSTEAGDEPMTEFSNLSAELAKAFQELEATFLRTVEGQTGRAPQEYPIGEVLSAVGGFLRVLKLNNVAGAGPPCAPQSPHDAHLRSKQASIAAQGYVLCVKLVASLSEQMLQGLLTSPSPTASGGSTSPQSTQGASSLRTSLEASDGKFSDASHVPHSLRLGDLFMPPGHFGHALNSSVNLLRIGCSRLNEMEHLLGIPSKQQGQSISSLVCQEQMDFAQQALPDNGSPRPSLPARFVAAMWEDEASVKNKSAVVYLQRCRAAILGLTEHCA